MANHVDGLDLEAWGDVPPMPCGHERRYIYSANERAEITTSTCMMCALQSASARIAELEAERDAANKRAEQADAERDELKNDVIICNVCPSCGRESLFLGKGGWLTCYRKDCEQPSVRISIENLRAERDAALTEAELHRVAMRRIVFAVFGRDLAEDEHTDVDSICEWIHGLRAENQNMLKRAEQAEADARALANIARRLRHDRRNAQEAELIAKYLDGVK